MTNLRTGLVSLLAILPVTVVAQTGAGLPDAATSAAQMTGTGSSGSKMTEPSIYCPSLSRSAGTCT